MKSSVLGNMSGSISGFEGISMTPYTFATVRGAQGESYCNVYEMGDSMSTHKVQCSDISASGLLYFSITYVID